VRLLESHPSLSAICRAVENRLGGVAELPNLELPIVLFPNFDLLPEVQLSNSYRVTPFAYQCKERRIIVNQQGFSSLPTPICEAALAHEIAHALCQRDRIVMRDPEYGLVLSEEIVADFLACKWGFHEGLVQERLTSYGARYCEILALWSREREFVHSMVIWHQQRLAGVSRAFETT
jgi:hypothetical protein